MSCFSKRFGNNAAEKDRKSNKFSKKLKKVLDKLVSLWYNELIKNGIDN